MHPLRHWVATHTGMVRASNQDAHLCRPEIGLFVVADGVGGQGSGELASAEVVRELELVPSGLAPLDLLEAVRVGLGAAHHRLLSSALKQQKISNATTVVVLLLHGEHLACLWAGDSRAYLFRDGNIIRLTFDHSLVGEMQRAGNLTQAEAMTHPNGNVITRAIGVDCEVALVDKVIATTQLGDQFLLCSDGLIKAVPEAELVGSLGAEDPAQALVAAAIARGARDNVTALVVRI